jgi:hypothetical protein
MRRALILAVALGISAMLAGVAAAGAADAAKGNQNVETYDKASPKLLTGKVTEVNSQAKTFTVIAKGKSVVFSGAKLTKLPSVGQVVDITYTETPGGGPLDSTNLNSSRSNIY